MSDSRILLTGGSGFIGTHLVSRLLEHLPDAEILNLDIEKPKLTAHDRFWRKSDLMDGPALTDAVVEFNPTHVIHLAARTDSDGTKVDDYRINIVGSANLIEAIKQVPHLQRTVFVSTQYVVKPGPLAKSFSEYRPVNFYGESKQQMEEMIRRTDGIPGIWTIVRPTNIWGPWHPRYAEEFWLVVKKGRYVHPGGKPVTRAYGYVGNVVEYMLRILEAEPALVKGQTYYLGDPVDDIKIWVRAFTTALTGRGPRVVPRAVLRSIAFVGDAVRMTGRSFPLFSSRYRSMTQDYTVDMNPTFEALGPPRYRLEEGVQSTVEWLRTQDDLWRR
jgi:GlcNAc-P-P-Und epimerase